MSRRQRRRKLPTEPATLQIRSLSHEGRGVAELDGKVCFVNGALAGESVQARFVSKRAKFNELDTTEVLEASAERVEPPCQYASQCGGCSLQHWHSAAQLKFKESVLFELLEHACGVSAETFGRLTPLTGPNTGYRRKARLAVRVVSKKGGALVGFREKHSSFITDMLSCDVLSPAVARLLPGLRELIDNMECSREIPQIEVAVGEEAAEPHEANQVALVVRHLQPLPEADQELLRQFASREAVDFYLQPKGPDTIHRLVGDGANAEVERLYYYLPEFKLKLGFHPSDFTQVNGEINRRMLNQALTLLDLQKDDRVLDLFCGLGNFSLPIATRAATVVGVEGSQAMVDRAQENALANELSNTAFYAADLTEGFVGSSWAKRDYNKMLLDPPRSGALELVPGIIGSAAKTLVYVSCNPATLARDAAALIAGGFELKTAGVMDMFPHTTHVESMALFTR